MNHPVVRNYIEVNHLENQELSANTKKHRVLDEWVRRQQPDQPTFILYPDVIAARVSAFTAGLGANILYAVKCNPHPKVLQAVYNAGITRFETASLPEIQLAAKLGYAAKCYFHHPIKSRNAIQEAATHHSVRHFTIDCHAELDKITDTITPDAKTVHVRVATPHEGASCDFTEKFGATATEAVVLLKAVVDRGFHAGISFHVGSQCCDPKLFVRALDLVAHVALTAAVDISWINCGGGFPVATAPQVKVPPLSDFFDALSARLPALRRKTGARILVEPGRVLVADAVRLVVQVHQRRNRKIYLNDGVYGALSNGCCGCKRKFLVRTLGDRTGPKAEFTIFGPTCDATDKLKEPWLLPDDIAEGDWIEIASMGAYAGALASRFNGFHEHCLVVRDSSGIG